MCQLEAKGLTYIVSLNLYSNGDIWVKRLGHREVKMVVVKVTAFKRQCPYLNQHSKHQMH